MRSVLIHLAGDPTTERTRRALRFALVALSEHRIVTVLLSGTAVELARATGDLGCRADQRDIALLVEAFLDRGGTMWLLNASAADHGVHDDQLPDGAVIVTPRSILDQLTDAVASLTF